MGAAGRQNSRFSARVAFAQFAFVAAVTLLFPSWGRAGTWLPFGPKTYTRGPGDLVTVTNTFTLLNPAAQYTLKAFNGANSSGFVPYCVVMLNGVRIIGAANFAQDVRELDIPITPKAFNTISVQVRGKLGVVLALEIVGVDNDPPIISAAVNPPLNAAGWNNSGVTVSFTCSDKTSGVASCPPPITIGTEGANQVVSGTATDLAGNTATASVTVNLDMTPPTIAGTISPPPDAAGFNSTPVTVSFTCSDALSGVASCPPSVSLTTEGVGQVVNGLVTDFAGNISKLTITVNISFNNFLIRSYLDTAAGGGQGKCLDYGAAPNGSGASVFLNDCSLAHPIRVFEFGTPPGAPLAVTRTGSRGTPLGHEVMLFAGKHVIGIHVPQPITTGGPPPPAPTQYDLELQVPWSAPTSVSNPANQIFRLDGDSIILEGTSVDPMTGAVVPGPCINSAFPFPPPALPIQPQCPDPLPQLVVQIQKARGANGSPIEVNVRNLSEHEFWDFVATDGSGKDPTTGFMRVSTNDGLWNAICGSPQFQVTGDPPQTPSGPLLLQLVNPNPVKSLYYGCPSNVGWGSVIVVSSPTDCHKVPGPLSGQTQDIGGCIDLSLYPPIALPAGVTIRGGRRGTLFGPQLYYSYYTTSNYVNLVSGGNISLNSARQSAFLCQLCVIQVQGDYVRVTGLRMRGESRSTDQSEPTTDGIQIDYAGKNTRPAGPPPQIPLFPLDTITELIATIDHDDMSDWGDAAVISGGPFGNSTKSSDRCTYRGYVDPNGSPDPDYYTCDRYTQTVPYSPYLVSLNPNLTPVTVADDPGTLANLRVARNFLHHNERNEGGYGVNGNGLVEANTFLQNRHDITSSGEPHSEYRASNNLVLSSAPNYGGLIGRLQDFDMHGTDNVGVLLGDKLYFGGAAGYYVEVAGNTFLAPPGSTFLPPEGHDYVLRGYPVVNSFYHDNVSLRHKQDAVHFIHCNPFIILVNCISDYNAQDFPINPHDLSGNQFSDSTPPYTDPTAQIAVGDFDGDGIQDTFLATGAGWYYSPGGSMEWRYLNSAPDTIDQLLFGDFDGDGRTDVVGMRSGKLYVSWGGVSSFELLNPNPPANCGIADMAVGDFDGDGKPDIFCADWRNNTWWISYGGNSAFVAVNTNNFPRSAFLFGDFNGDGTTDVFGIVSNGSINTWSYTPSARGTWVFLQPAQTNTVAGLVVGDFDGDGNADIAMSCGTSCLKISYGGSQVFTTFTNLGSLGLVNGGVGHFSGGTGGVDLLVWNGTEFWVAPSAIGTPYALSNQDMK